MTFLYVLKCEDDAWYVGVTCNPKQRFNRHWRGEGSLYTTAYKPLKIVYMRAFSRRAEAFFGECSMTSLLRQYALKVGGALRCWPGPSGRGTRSPFKLPTL